MTIRTFGIRHHGPGSARRLLAALATWQPDCLLIEGPADGQAAIAQLVRKGMEPPVAMVLYAENDIANASFLPFAAFSPEYQAILWGHENNCPYFLIDLPAQHYLVRPVAEEQLQLFQIPRPLAVEEKMAARLRQDPLALLAELAGYQDSERWWDATVERGGLNDEMAVFEALSEAITQLRTAYPSAVDTHTLQREAYMREQIRKAIKNGYQRIAVVVGAWHCPAIEQLMQHKATADKALLKGLPKLKVKAAWIPWSYPRLAKQSGYGAGLVSPAWYELLFAEPTQAIAYWMVSAAQLLREEGFEASPALAADGVALAAALARLRGLHYAGAEELDQAVLGTLAAGNSERLQLIQERLIIGKKVGSVPPGSSTVPLLADFQKALKATRLHKLWEISGQHYLKATTSNPRGGIDLREENDLGKSHLLHRLALLDIPWGQLQPISANAISSFREIWLLEWQPEFNLFITERSAAGNTLELAASRYTLEKARGCKALNHLAELVLAALRADLPTLVNPLIRQLRSLTTLTHDVPALLAALPAIVNTCRYGDSRKTDTSALLLLVQEVVPRLASNLVVAATHIDSEQSQQLMRLMAQANYALARLSGPDLLTIWHKGLESLLNPPGIAAAVRGIALRLLFDQQLLAAANTTRHFHYALSKNQGPVAVAEFLSGFLHGGSQLLLHYPPLWLLLSDWVAALSSEEFEGVLPLLRRCLSDFSTAERRQIFGLLEKEHAEASLQIPLGQSDLAETASTAALPIATTQGNTSATVASPAKQLTDDTATPALIEALEDEALVAALQQWIGV